MIYSSSRKEFLEYLYKILIAELPDKPWVSAFQKINRNTKRSPSIDILGENLISYGLHLWEARSSDVLDDYEDWAMANALYYCALFINLTKTVKPERRAELISKFKAAFMRPSSMRSIMVETFLFHAFRGMNYRVECKDDEIAKETYDFLVTKGNIQLQVECKSFAYDKGLVISSREAQELASLIIGRKPQLQREAEGEVCFLTIDILKEIGSSLEERESLVDAIFQALNNQLDPLDERFKIHLEYASNVENIDEVDGPLIVPVIAGDGSELATYVSAPDGRKSRFFLRIFARTADAFWREFEKVCKIAAAEQLNSDRPSSIVLHISNIDSLDRITKSPRFQPKLNNVFGKSHVVSVIFVSDIEARGRSTFPWLEFAPAIQEFQNNNSKFPGVPKLFAYEN